VVSCHSSTKPLLPLSKSRRTLRRSLHSALREDFLDSGVDYLLDPPSTLCSTHFLCSSRLILRPFSNSRCSSVFSPTKSKIKYIHLYYQSLITPSRTPVLGGIPLSNSRLSLAASSSSSNENRPFTIPSTSSADTRPYPLRSLRQLPQLGSDGL
jgi:hypothetical protein